MLRPTVSRSVCRGVKPPSGAQDQIFITVRQLRVYRCGALSLTRGRVSFTIGSDPRQRSHSQVRDPRDSRSYFTVSDSSLPQPGGPGPRIYISQEQGGPVIPPKFTFHRLRLAGLLWRYSNPLPREDGSATEPSPSKQPCLKSLVTAVFAGFTILAVSKHAIIFKPHNYDFLRVRVFLIMLRLGQ
jgi:hypothetical protein